MDNGSIESTREGDHYSLFLHPHRSLSDRGFFIFMACLCGISFVAGMAFVLMGAWPVFGFFGLDVLLIYWAFKANFKSAKRVQIIEIKDGQLIFRSIDPKGRSKDVQFDAYWCRVKQQEDRLYIACRSEIIEFGQFLIPDEKDDVAEELKMALHRYRNPVYA
ncbi:DUF2244 domain-containing protein [Sneathiella limimaris]|uniref:DUF2244 domain-containing protein n=1 Tax=Sneathiella limimaris TaxID=1964213 RepID=UPI00146B1CBD|nr:DUF2244 domain-containing protein [Sneathiella limimaris]